jgi:hypothetical protein
MSLATDTSLMFAPASVYCSRFAFTVRSCSSVVRFPQTPARSIAGCVRPVAASQTVRAKRAAGIVPNVRAVVMAVPCGPGRVKQATRFFVS